MKRSDAAYLNWGHVVEINESGPQGVPQGSKFTSVNLMPRVVCAGKAVAEASVGSQAASRAAQTTRLNS
ncbi:hypothetical protein Q7C36_021183 [Tachysurus vachellii]|uniref:Uncharacterized protein n=1 Tax=Tachysurus vachellii TaxID=175792 RepID=A0AA88J560_TACVA|nr:hypothetical protein Q7C36_021183 [Tachysurus vachellii]